MAGVDDGEEPPVPIPNTEVKLTCAEDSWLETACENREMPASLFYGPLVKRLRQRPLTPLTWVRFPHGSPRQHNPNLILYENGFGFCFCISALYTK